ncbi:hypothetical protein K227x_57540 [Rubripirellula lacrimiformis]|uniref:Thioredoxin domain-containing protein n=1 Tax=Rubripirellula lacrimiformis TaxID=1930273 RepID=A0A517NJL8_9BACT|nr:hypothetical protein [Rubripirellula lacrimiformis]QDT07327.1 hypothetical protein K227x_57540 [Rubripirellula lacrimiformis]
MARPYHLIVRLMVALLLATPVAIAAFLMTSNSPMPILDDVINQLPVHSVAWTGIRNAEPVVIGDWPPQKGQRYPDLILADQDGQTVRLSDFAGKVILLELAAVPCKGCQAFAGGQEFGGFAGVAVQPNLESIHHYADRFAGVDLGKDDVVFVQLLLYGKSMSSPSQAEVAGWAKHFQMKRTEKTIVLRGDASMLGIETYEKIPGFHLIDEQFVLRYDSSGHHPGDDLYQDLLPALGRMVP